MTILCLDSITITSPRGTWYIIGTQYIFLEYMKVRGGRITLWLRWSNRNWIYPPAWDNQKNGQNIWNSSFQKTGYQAIKDGDSWEIRSKQGEPCLPQLNVLIECPGNSVGRGIPRSFWNTHWFKIWSWESRETKVARVCWASTRIEPWGCTKGHPQV